VALYIHRNFDVQTFKNDVALLKLGHPVDASSLYVRPACLPDNSTDFDDMICTITGWGAEHISCNERLRDSIKAMCTHIDVIQILTG
jgi:hypothetical protein